MLHTFGIGVLLVTELGQLVPVQHQTILGGSNHTHVGFQCLGTVVLDEGQRDVVLEAILLCFLNHLELLLVGAEHHDAG